MRLRNPIFRHPHEQQNLIFKMANNPTRYHHIKKSILRMTDTVYYPWYCCTLMAPPCGYRRGIDNDLGMHYRSLTLHLKQPLVGWTWDYTLFAWLIAVNRSCKFLRVMNCNRTTWIPDGWQPQAHLKSTHCVNLAIWLRTCNIMWFDFRVYSVLRNNNKAVQKKT